MSRDRRQEDGLRGERAERKGPASQAQATDASKGHRGRSERHHGQLHDRLEARAAEEVTIHGHEMQRANLFKLAGLIAFFIIVGISVWALWPLFGKVFEPGGTERVVADVRAAGPWGYAMLFGLEVLQVIVAFIPGEVVQIAAGILYGPYLGTLLILLGCLASSALIYELVHRLGQPFVEAMAPTKYLERFREFERSGKLKPIVLFLFLVPGLPKDVFTYLVPLTDMKRGEYLLITTFARTPGVFASAYAASGILDGNVIESIAIFAVVGGLALLALLFRDRLIALAGRKAKGAGAADGEKADRGAGDDAPVRRN